MMKKIIIAAFIAGVLVAVAGVYSFERKNNPIVTACTMEAKICPNGSAVGRSGPQCEFAECPVTESKRPVSEFSVPFVVHTGDVFSFSDGMTITVKETGDSRCKAGVVCIWAGELYALLTPINGNFPENSPDIRLGTLTSKTIKINGYVFSIAQDETDIVTIAVSLIK